MILTNKQFEDFRAAERSVLLWPILPLLARRPQAPSTHIQVMNHPTGDIFLRTDQISDSDNISEAEYEAALTAALVAHKLLGPLPGGKARRLFPLLEAALATIRASASASTQTPSCPEL